MKYCVLVSFLIIAALCGSSCTNIDELSDNNSIAEFQVLSHTPNVIEIGNTELDGDDIYIPIIYGQSKFPLRFYANLTIDVDIDKIVGIDFSKEQCLESIDDEIKFYVMAKSGLTRIYYIRARVVDPNENNYLFSTFKLRGVSPETMVAERGLLSTQGDTLKIYTVAGKFPLTITPEFKIDENASFRNFENGKTSLKFDNARTVHKIKVVARDGAERLWNVKVINTPLISGGDTNVSDEKRLTTSIEPREFSASIDQPGFMVDEYFVDNVKDEIVLTIKEGKSRAANVTFPLNVNVKFTTFDGVDLFKITNESVVVFKENYQNVHEFYMLDATECVSRKWTIRLNEWTGSSADVLSFSYDYSAATVTTDIKYQLWPPGMVSIKTEKCIDMASSPVEIYPDVAEIYIPAQTIRYESYYWPYDRFPQKKWKLTLNNIKIGLSKGAKCTLPTFEWASNATWGSLGIGYVDNNCWETPKTFTVTAENGTTKEWTLKIREPNDTQKSDACELSGLSVKSVRPNYALLDPKMPVVMNNETKVISIKMADDEGCYPLSIYPEYAISQYAKITTQNGGTEPLVFSAPTATEQVTVSSQSGLKTETWTVKLIPPIKINDANVTKFTINTYTPSNFGVDSTRINQKEGKITIYLNRVGAFPFNVDATMVLSDRATSSVGLKNTFSFSKMQEIKEFNVTSQSGVNKPWIVALNYRQVLPDGDFDWMVGDLANPLWSTANNSFVTGTSAESRNGGLAAVLTSKTTLGKFAAGSVLLGKFKFDMGRGMNDPISLTWFGIPFQSTAKIKGMYVDMCYIGGPNYVDFGSAVIELVNYNNTASDPTYANYQYHGLYPNGDGPRSSGFGNNAVAVARGEYFFGNEAGMAIHNTPITVVPRGEWHTVFVPIVYPNPSIIPTYTHLNIVFSSSGRGASFEGALGTVLKLDNVRLVYEEE